jgi:spermidine synthase
MVPYITLGFVSLLLQLTVLRELLTVFSGNELDIGITLSLWLVSVGLGSFTGTRLRLRNAFALSFVLVALLAEPTVYGIRFIRPLLGLGYGEAASLGGTFIGTALVLFPLCFSLGLQFPLAVSFRGGKNPAAAVYGLEAAGAFAGGVLFTFLISGRVEAAGLATALSLVCVLLAVLILRKKVVIAALVIPFVVHAGVGLLKPPRLEGGELLKKVQSRYGEIWVTSLGDQMSLYGSGQYLFSYPDHQSEELSVHLPMAVVKPSSKRVLALGGSPAALREFVKYPVERVDFIEIDPALLKTSLGVLDEEDRRALEDERVRIVIEDGRRFIKSLGRAEYDMLVMNLSPPSTANLNRFYTVEFFEEARAVLRPGGVLALRLPSSAGYVGRRMQLANGSIYNSLRSVFRHVELTTEEYGGLFASDSPIEISPEKLISEFNQRGLDLKHFHFYVLADAFMPLRAEFHKKRLGAVDALNTDLRPSAYLYNLMLWAEVHGGVLNTVLSFKGFTITLVAIGVFIAAAFGVLRRRARTLYYSMFTTGYAAMALVLAIVLGYQASYGYVYEMMGLLGAVFMVGVALGSYAMRGGGSARLMGLEAATVVFALLAPGLFKVEVLFYLLSFAAGVITGYQFALVNRLMGHVETGPGRLYAFDLAGSFLGAVLSAIIFIPMAGIQGSLLFLAGVKSISLFAVSLIKNE